MKRYRNLAFFLAASALAALALAVYWPGLHGGFLFDDFGNLPALGSQGPVDNWPTFWRYLTSGGGDPTGRPLTLLTFLVDAHNWPADPLLFKRSNLILHLLNGGLLALLLRQLGRQSFRRTPSWRVDLAALLGAGFWLLHPLLVSTTLYVIQREAMLPATFTLLGLLAWLRSRNALLQGGHAPGLLWLVTGLGACTLLGVLSKANGILLPALALVIEYALLRVAEDPVLHTDKNRRFYERAMGVTAWLPTVVVAAYLIYQGWQGLFQPGSGLRPWTLGQRLLTEPRVLMQYLNLLWLPRPFTPGLFNDQIHVSRSLWKPATTLPAIFALLALLVAGWLLRRRWPAASLAILFYFVGQSIESSTISLELYFEHRNYLPALLMFWPLALWLSGINGRAWATADADSLMQHARPQDTIAIGQTQLRRVNSKVIIGTIARFWIAILILLGLALMTRARSELWGDTHDQALLWARLNPDSTRAQTHAAEEELASGQFKAAQRRLASALIQHPEQVELAFNLLDAQCFLGGIDTATLQATRAALRTTRDPGSLLVSWFGAKISAPQATPCAGLTPQVLGELLEAAMSNPHLTIVAGRLQDLYNLQGRLALRADDGPAALGDFNRALDQDVHPSVALEQAAILGSAGYPRLGLDHLDHFDTVRGREKPAVWGMSCIHAWVLQRQHYWQHGLARLRHQLALDARAVKTNTVGSSAFLGKTR